MKTTSHNTQLREICAVVLSLLAGGVHAKTISRTINRQLNIVNATPHTIVLPVDGGGDNVNASSFSYYAVPNNINSSTVTPFVPLQSVQMSSALKILPYHTYSIMPGAQVNFYNTGGAKDNVWIYLGPDGLQVTNNITGAETTYYSSDWFGFWLYPQSSWNGKNDIYSEYYTQSISYKLYYLNPYASLYYSFDQKVNPQLSFQTNVEKFNNNSLLKRQSINYNLDNLGSSVNGYDPTTTADTPFGVPVSGSISGTQLNQIEKNNSALAIFNSDTYIITPTSFNYTPSTRGTIDQPSGSNLSSMHMLYTQTNFVNNTGKPLDIDYGGSQPLVVPANSTVVLPAGTNYQFVENSNIIYVELPNDAKPYILNNATGSKTYFGGLGDWYEIYITTGMGSSNLSGWQRGQDTGFEFLIGDGPTDTDYSTENATGAMYSLNNNAVEFYNENSQSTDMSYEQTAKTDNKYAEANGGEYDDKQYTGAQVTQMEKNLGPLDLFKGSETYLLQPYNPNVNQTQTTLFNNPANRSKPNVVKPTISYVTKQQINLVNNTRKAIYISGDGNNGFTIPAGETLVVPAGTTIHWYNKGGSSDNVWVLFNNEGHGQPYLLNNTTGARTYLQVQDTWYGFYVDPVNAWNHGQVNGDGYNSSDNGNNSDNGSTPFAAFSVNNNAIPYVNRKAAQQNISVQQELANLLHDNRSYSEYGIPNMNISADSYRAIRDALAPSDSETFVLNPLSSGTSTTSKNAAYAKDKLPSKYYATKQINLINDSNKTLLVTLNGNVVTFPKNDILVLPKGTTYIAFSNTGGGKDELTVTTTGGAFLIDPTTGDQTPVSAASYEMNVNPKRSWQEEQITPDEYKDYTSGFLHATNGIFTVIDVNNEVTRSLYDKLTGGYGLSPYQAQAVIEDTRVALFNMSNLHKQLIDIPRKELSTSVTPTDVQDVKEQISAYIANLEYNALVNKFNLSKQQAQKVLRDQKNLLTAVFKIDSFFSKDSSGYLASIEYKDLTEHLGLTKAEAKILMEYQKVLLTQAINSDAALSAEAVAFNARVKEAIHEFVKTIDRADVPDDILAEILNKADNMLNQTNIVGQAEYLQDYIKDNHLRAKDLANHEEHDSNIHKDRLDLMFDASELGMLTDLEISDLISQKLIANSALTRDAVYRPFDSNTFAITNYRQVYTPWRYFHRYLYTLFFLPFVAATGGAAGVAILTVVVSGSELVRIGLDHGSNNLRHDFDAVVAPLGIGMMIVGTVAGAVAIYEFAFEKIFGADVAIEGARDVIGFDAGPTGDDGEIAMSSNLKLADNLEQNTIEVLNDTLAEDENNLKTVEKELDAIKAKSIDDELAEDKAAVKKLEAEYDAINTKALNDKDPIVEQEKAMADESAKAWNKYVDAKKNIEKNDIVKREQAKAARVEKKLEEYNKAKKKFEAKKENYKNYVDKTRRDYDDIRANIKKAGSDLEKQRGFWKKLEYTRIKLSNDPFFGASGKFGALKLATLQEAGISIDSFDTMVRENKGDAKEFNLKRANDVEKNLIAAEEKRISEEMALENEVLRKKQFKEMTDFNMRRNEELESKKLETLEEREKFHSQERIDRAELKDKQDKEWADHLNALEEKLIETRVNPIKLEFEKTRAKIEAAGNNVTKQREIWVDLEYRRIMSATKDNNIDIAIETNLALVERMRKGVRKVYKERIIDGEDVNKAARADWEHHYDMIEAEIHAAGNDLDKQGKIWNRLEHDRIDKNKDPFWGPSRKFGFAGENFNQKVLHPEYPKVEKFVQPIKVTIKAVNGDFYEIDNVGDSIAKVVRADNGELLSIGDKVEVHKNGISTPDYGRVFERDENGVAKIVIEKFVQPKKVTIKAVNGKFYEEDAAGNSIATVGRADNGGRLLIGDKVAVYRDGISTPDIGKVVEHDENDFAKIIIEKVPEEKFAPRAINKVTIKKITIKVDNNGNFYKQDDNGALVARIGYINDGEPLGLDLGDKIFLTRKLRSNAILMPDLVQVIGADRDGLIIQKMKGSSLPAGKPGEGGNTTEANADGADGQKGGENRLKGGTDDENIKQQKITITNKINNLADERTKIIARRDELNSQINQKKAVLELNDLDSTVKDLLKAENDEAIDRLNFLNVFAGLVSDYISELTGILNHLDIFEDITSDEKKNVINYLKAIDDNISGDDMPKVNSDYLNCKLELEKHLSDGSSTRPVAANLLLRANLAVADELSSKAANILDKEIDDLIAGQRKLLNDKSVYTKEVTGIEHSFNNKISEVNKYFDDKIKRQAEYLELPDEHPDLLENKYGDMTFDEQKTAIHRERSNMLAEVNTTKVKMMTEVEIKEKNREAKIRHTIAEYEKTKPSRSIAVGKSYQDIKVRINEIGDNQEKQVKIWNQLNEARVNPHKFKYEYKAPIVNAPTRIPFYAGVDGTSGAEALKSNLELAEFLQNSVRRNHDKIIKKGFEEDKAALEQDYNNKQKAIRGKYKNDANKQADELLKAELEYQRKLKAIEERAKLYNEGNSNVSSFSSDIKRYADLKGKIIKADKDVKKQYKLWKQLENERMELVKRFGDDFGISKTMLDTLNLRRSEAVRWIDHQLLTKVYSSDKQMRVLLRLRVFLSNPQLTEETLNEPMEELYEFIQKNKPLVDLSNVLDNIESISQQISRDIGLIDDKLTDNKTKLDETWKDLQDKKESYKNAIKQNKIPSTDLERNINMLIDRLKELRRIREELLFEQHLNAYKELRLEYARKYTIEDLQSKLETKIGANRFELKELKKYNHEDYEAFKNAQLYPNHMNREDRYSIAVFDAGVDGTNSALALENNLKFLVDLEASEAAANEAIFKDECTRLRKLAKDKFDAKVAKIKRSYRTDSVWARLKNKIKIWTRGPNYKELDYLIEAEEIAQVKLVYDNELEAIRIRETSYINQAKYDYDGERNEIISVGFSLKKQRKIWKRLNKHSSQITKSLLDVDNPERAVEGELQIAIQNAIAWINKALVTHVYSREETKNLLYVRNLLANPQLQQQKVIGDLLETVLHRENREMYHNRLDLSRDMSKATNIAYMAWQDNVSKYISSENETLKEDIYDTDEALNDNANTYNEVRTEYDLTKTAYDKLNKQDLREANKLEKHLSSLEKAQAELIKIGEELKLRQRVNKCRRVRLDYAAKLNSMTKVSPVKEAKSRRILYSEYGKIIGRALPNKDGSCGYNAVIQTLIHDEKFANRITNEEGKRLFEEVKSLYFNDENDDDLNRANQALKNYLMKNLERKPTDFGVIPTDVTDMFDAGLGFSVRVTNEVRGSIKDTGIYFGSKHVVYVKKMEDGRNMILGNRAKISDLKTASNSNLVDGIIYKFDQAQYVTRSINKRSAPVPKIA